VGESSCSGSSASVLGASLLWSITAHGPREVNVRIADIDSLALWLLLHLVYALRIHLVSCISYHIRFSLQLEDRPKFSHIRTSPGRLRAHAVGAASGVGGY